MCACSPWGQPEIQSNLSVSNWHFPKMTKAAHRASSTHPKSECSKDFKIAFWPRHRRGPHSPCLILLHISVGIVRIHKSWILMGWPFWLEKTHNALCCCCELLTAWAGPQQRQAVLRSLQRGGIFDISPWWQPCYYSGFILYASSLCGPMSPVATHKIWFGWQILSGSGVWTHPAHIKAWAVIFKGCLTYAGREFIGDTAVHGEDEVSEALFLVYTNGAQTTGPWRICIIYSPTSLLSCVYFTQYLVTWKTTGKHCPIRLPLWKVVRKHGVHLTINMQRACRW